MEIVYKNKKIEKQCTSLKESAKLFGGNKMLAISLQSRINAIKAASVIKDIILMPQMRFHQMKGDRKGAFAIDVKTKRENWRIILRPLDENKERFDPCNIDEIASYVEIVEITEVSNHYE